MTWLQTHLPCAALVLDASSRIKQASEALSSMTGRPVESVIDQPFEELFTPATSALYQGYVLPLLMLHGRVEEIGLSLRCAGGGTFDVLLYACVVREDPDTPMRVVLVTYRNRKAVDDELLKIKRAADQSPAMIFELVREASGHRRFTYVSSAVQSLFGCTPQQAIADARRVFGRMRPEDTARLEASESDRPEARQHFTVPVRASVEGAEPAWHEWHASSRRRSDGAIVWAGHVADVSVQRALQEEAMALRAAEQARQAQVQFLGRVSHELRTPLNAVLGFTQLLAMSVQDGESALNRQHIDLIGSAGRRLLRLVDDVLDLARVRNADFDARPVATSLAPLVDACVAMFAPQAARAQVAFSVDVADGLRVQADATRLSQALDNLLSNAIKYNRPGGSVRVSAARRDGGIVLDVVDTGIGLDDRQRVELFQPFNRLGAERSAVAGTGLGLVITAQIVQAMGGRIDVSSSPGHGSCFSIWLPAAEASPDEVDAAAVEPAAAPDGLDLPCDVLYLEDDPVSVLLLKAIASQVPGLRLTVATSGAAALQAAEREPPVVLLSDHCLPDMEASAVLSRLRSNAGSRLRRAILVTAEVGAEGAPGGSGFDECWLKPLDVPFTRTRLAALCVQYRPLAARSA